MIPRPTGTLVTAKLRWQILRCSGLGHAAAVAERNADSSQRTREQNKQQKRVGGKWAR